MPGIDRRLLFIEGGPGSSCLQFNNLKDIFNKISLHFEKEILIYLV